MKASPLRQSIPPTYDSRQTGPRFKITSSINEVVICDALPLADPFVTHRIEIHWWDALKAFLFCRRLSVVVSVSGDSDIMEDVMELDNNYLGTGSTRRHEFQRRWNESLEQFAESLEDED